MKKFFLALTALLGALPGLAIIKSGIGTPPEYNQLFGGVVEAFGVLTLLILWVNRGKLRDIRNKTVTKVAITLGVIFFVFIAVYVLLFNLCVVDHLRGTVYYPLWLDGEIADMVSRAGSRRGAIEKYGIAAVVQAVDKIPSTSFGVTPLAVTTVVLLFVYQAIFTTLTSVFGFLGFHKGEEL